MAAGARLHNIPRGRWEGRREESGGGRRTARAAVVLDDSDAVTEFVGPGGASCRV